MENKEFFAALTDLVKEKGISEEAFIQTLENALASAYKKQFDGGAEIAVSLDAEKGTTKIAYIWKTRARSSRLKRAKSPRSAARSILKRSA